MHYPKSRGAVLIIPFGADPQKFPLVESFLQGLNYFEDAHSIMDVLRYAAYHFNPIGFASSPHLGKFFSKPFYSTTNIWY